MDETILAGAIVLGAILFGGRTARAATTKAPPVQVPAGGNGEVAARNRVLHVARTELDLGICEVPDGSNTSTEPNGGIAKYGMPPDFWCMRFVKWVFEEALRQGAHIPLFPSLGGGGSVMRTKDSAEELGIYTPASDPYWDPGQGDILIMSRDGGGTGHTGIIYTVVRDATGTVVALWAIEGNTDNCVKLRYRTLSAGNVLGSIDPYSA